MPESHLLRRIGIIGDVHAEDSLLASALPFIRDQGVDCILSMGDIADGFGDVNRCCELLKESGVFAVRGNHDRWRVGNEMWELAEATPPAALSATSRDFLAGLPPTRTFETVAGPLLHCHGLGMNDMVRLNPEDEGYALEANEDLQALIRAGEFRFVACGHTHRRMVRRFDALTVINAGALVRTLEPGFGVVDFGKRSVGWFDFQDAKVVPGPEARF